MAFERFHLVADRAGRNAKLLAGRLQAAAPRQGLEGAQGCEGRYLSCHDRIGPERYLIPDIIAAT
jgi:hypothetical protein